jgi:hypothetical protein
MNRVSNTAVMNLEIYLLMTMKLRMRMSHKEAQLEAKLAEHGLSVDDAERVHVRIGEALGDKASGFESLKNLLGIAESDSPSLEYSSVFWPGFEFKAVAGKDGLLESARYWHARHDSSSVDCPTELPIWSMDVSEFTERFGPMRHGRQWPLFDELLPGYEEYEFPWNGESYGAGFSWGLFMFAAKSWPED